MCAAHSVHDVIFHRGDELYIPGTLCTPLSRDVSLLPCALFL